MAVHAMNHGDTILLTMDEAAGALTMCKRTLERLMAAGEFPQPLRFTARCVRVPASDVDAYIERQLRRRNGGRANA
jgi:excisionase family DNA binding protein